MNEPLAASKRQTAVCIPLPRAFHDPLPSATVFVVATFVDPEAKHYDSTKNSYVVGPVTSKVYYQFAGIRHLEQLGISQPKPN